MLSVFMIVVVIILFFLLCAGAYYHVWMPIRPRIEATGGETLVYEPVIGDYKQTGTITNKVYYALLNIDGIETFKGFAIFYDNPKKIAKSQLRSDVGCILQDADVAKIDSQKLLSKYSIKQCEHKEYLVTQFPYRGIPSIVLGLIKVYPALSKFAEQSGFEADSPVMEIYDVPNKVIVYRKKLIKRNGSLLSRSQITD
jgi:hypothetical protein